MGGLTLLRGDCLAVMPSLPDSSVDMVLCDLPYGTTQCRWDTVIDLPSLWAEYRRIVKPSGAIVLFAAMPFSAVLVGSNLTDYRYEWVWVKSKATRFLDAKKRPLQKHETLQVFSRETIVYNPQMREGDVHKRGSKSTGPGEVYNDFSNRVVTESSLYYPTTVVSFAVEPKPTHPTAKPVALLEYMIETYTQRGETVLDNCMGTGSTGVACINTGRKFIGIEQDARYFRDAEWRLSWER